MHVSPQGKKSRVLTSPHMLHLHKNWGKTLRITLMASLWKLSSTFSWRIPFCWRISLHSYRNACKWVDVGSLQMGLVYFQADIQEQCAASDPAAFWMQTVPKTTFPGLTKVAVALTMFWSTCSRESVFSTVSMIKNNWVMNICIHAYELHGPRFTQTWLTSVRGSTVL